MKKLISFSVFLSLLFLFYSHASAEVPQMINYQGKLTNATGAPVNDTLQMVFTIYSDTGGTNLLWTETQSAVVVEKGVFNVLLGSVDSIPYSVFDGSIRYLGVKVGDDPEITPRKPMVSVAYAFHSGIADTAYFSMPDADWVIVEDTIYHLNGNVGIGTTSPTEKMHVSVSENGQGIRIESNTNTDNERAPALQLWPKSASPNERNWAISAYRDAPQGFSISSSNEEWGNPYGQATTRLYIDGINGNVGIGTTSPSTKLHVNGQSRFDGLMNLATNSGIEIAGDDGNILNIGSPYGVALSTSTDSAGVGFLTNNIWRMGINGNGNVWIDGNVGIGTTNPSGKLEVVGSTYLDGHTWVNGILALGDNQGAGIAEFGTDGLGFRVGDISDKVVIDNNGNVGIGTTSPLAKLHVAGSIRANGIGIGDYAGSWGLNVTGSNILLRSQDPRFYIADYTTTGFIGTDNAGNIQIAPDAVVSTTFNRNGNVGIGTTSPDARLSVLATSDEAASFRNNSSSVVSVWAYNTSGTAISCGTGSSSSYPFQAIAYDNDASKTAIQCNGSLNATGTITGNSIWNGVNAITGNSSGNYAAVAGINTSSGAGLYGKSTSGLAGDFDGNVDISGTLTKGGGSFKIDHPLDPAYKYLSHSFVESPDMMNIYNGNVILDANGEMWVDLPEWFEALNQDFRYQLTAIGHPGPNLYIAEEISGNRFKIAGGTQGMKVSWQVTGIRHDAYAEKHRIQVEEEKPPQERGKYLHPTELGMPETMGINYQETDKK